LIDILFYGGAAFLLIKGGWDLYRKKDTSYLFLGLGGALLIAYLFIRPAVLTTDPYNIPTSMFQAVNPFFIMIFGTIVGGFWIFWKRKGREASLSLQNGRRYHHHGYWLSFHGQGFRRH
jgi:hypothetical protein